MQTDFKDLLKEIERLRGIVVERDKRLEIMNTEMKALPSLVEANASKKLLA